MGAEEKLSHIAPSALENGSLVPFDEQVTRFALGELPSSEVLVVSTDSSKAGLPMLESAPLIIDQETIRKITGDHHLSLSDIRNLPTWFREHPLAMDSLSQPEAIVVIADFQDRLGNHVIMPVHIQKEMGDVGHRVRVDDIASVYGKRNLQYLIANTASAEKTLYVNERTKGWASRAGLQLPPLAPNHFINEYTRGRVTDLDQVKSPRDEEAAFRPHADRSEILNSAIVHGFDKLEEFRKRRVEEHVAPPEADIVLVRKGEPGPDGSPVAQDMVFAVSGEDGTVLGQNLLKTVAGEVEGIIDGSASVVPSVTAWISDHDLKEIAGIAKRPTNEQLYELLAGVNEKSDEVVYDPLTEKLFVGYAGRDEPEVHLYEHAALGEVVDKAAQIVLNEGAAGNDPAQVYVAYDDVYIGDFSRSWDLEDQGDLDSLRDEIMALPDTWSRPSMEPVTRSSVLAIAETCLAEQGRDSSAIYERAAEIAGFRGAQVGPVASLLRDGFTAGDIRRPAKGITEIDAGQMSTVMEAFGQAHFGDPGENSKADHEMAGLMQGRYMAAPDSPGGCFMILDNRCSVFDTQAMRTREGAILYLEAIGDAEDGKIEVNDWLHEVDGALAERPELADVYHMWDALCEGEAKRVFSGMSAEPLMGSTAFRDLWQGDAAQAARPLQVISALRDMADRHESAPLICGAILAFKDEGVECRQDHERALVRAIADNRANPYGERFGDPIEEAGAAMRREVVPAIEAEEGRRGIEDVAGREEPGAPDDLSDPEEVKGEKDPDAIR